MDENNIVHTKAEWHKGTLTITIENITSVNAKIMIDALRAIMDIIGDEVPGSYGHKEIKTQ